MALDGSGTYNELEVLTKPWSSNQKFMAGIAIPDTGEELFLYNYNKGPEGAIKIDLIPDSVSESYSPKVTKQTPFGIAQPLNFYVGGSEKTLSFSFTVHEDVIALQKENINLYEFVDRIKAMSNSSVGIAEDGDEYIKPPSVYFQLGNQFAGKGHITTKFSYSKPFVNGRYKMVLINLVFVFHELFETRSTETIWVDENVVMRESYGENLLIENEDIQKLGIDMPIEDFYNLAFGEDYYINQYDYISSKLEGLFKSSWRDTGSLDAIYDTDTYQFTVGSTKLDPNDNPNKFYEEVAKWYLAPKEIEDGTFGESYESTLTALKYGGYTSNDQLAIHPQIIEMMEILRRYYYIIGLVDSISYSDAVNNLSVLLTDINDLINRYLTTPAGWEDHNNYNKTGGQNRGVVWYNVEYTGTSIYYYMTKDELFVFDGIIGYTDLSVVGPNVDNIGIQGQIENYIRTYNMFNGAGG